MTGCVLEDSIRRVQPTAFEEHRTKRSTRTFRSYQDNIYISRRNDTCTFFVCDTKAMREIKCFPGCQVFFYCWPYFNLGSIRKQVLDNCCTLTSFGNIEKSFAWYPTIGYSFLPSFTTFALPYDHIKSIIAQVQRLARTLYTVTDNGNNLIFQYFTRFF